MTRRQFIVRPLSCQERPGTTLSPPQVRASVVPLSIAVMVIASPARPHRSFHLQNVIYYLQRIHHERIVGTPHTIPDQFQKACVDHVARFEIDPLSRSPVVDLDYFFSTVFARIGVSARGRTNAHVMPLHAGQQGTVIGHGPFFKMAFDGVRMFFEEMGQAVGSIRAHDLGGAYQSGDHRRQG